MGRALVNNTESPDSRGIVNKGMIPAFAEGSKDYKKKFYNGKKINPNGVSLVGEKGAELVSLPKGSQVMPKKGNEAKFKIIQAKLKKKK